MKEPDAGSSEGVRRGLADRVEVLRKEGQGGGKEEGGVQDFSME